MVCKAFDSAGVGAQTWFWSLDFSVKEAFTYHKEKKNKQGLCILQGYCIHTHRNQLQLGNRSPETTEVPVTTLRPCRYLLLCVCILTIGGSTSWPLCFHPSFLPLGSASSCLHPLIWFWPPSGLPVASACTPSSSESWEMTILEYYLVGGLIHTPTIIDSIFQSALKTVRMFWFNNQNYFHLKMGVDLHRWSKKPPRLFHS